jgi:hypothetical protein
MNLQTSTDKNFAEMTRQELLQFIGINYLQYIEKYGSKLQKLSREDLIEMAEDKNESLK